jgi:hypothetical protein
MLSNTASIVHSDQPDPTPENNASLVTVTIDMPKVVYLPAVTSNYIPPVGFPIFVGAAIPVRPVQYQGQVFYTRQVPMSGRLPSWGSFYFSAQSTLLAQVLVDDELVLLVDGRKVFAHDFSTSGKPVPATVEVPRAVIEQMVERTASVEYRDVYGSVIGASEMWLIWVP